MTCWLMMTAAQLDDLGPGPIYALLNWVRHDYLFKVALPPFANEVLMDSTLVEVDYAHILQSCHSPDRFIRIYDPFAIDVLAGTGERLHVGAV